MDIAEKLDIGQLSIPEKIGLMELLWQDISRHATTLEMPARHRQKLRDSEDALGRGEDAFIPLAEFMADVRRDVDKRRK